MAKTSVTKGDIANLYKLQKMIKELQEKEAIIKKKLVDELDTGKTMAEYKGVQYQVSHSVSNRLDAKEFQGDYPAADYPEYYKQALDSKAIPADVKTSYTKPTHSISVDVIQSL